MLPALSDQKKKKKKNKRLLKRKRGNQQNMRRLFNEVIYCMYVIVQRTLLFAIDDLSV